MNDRYTDAQLALMQAAVRSLKMLTDHGILRDSLIGKVFLLQGEIAREEKVREEERKAAEAAAAPPEMPAAPEPPPDPDENPAP